MAYEPQATPTEKLIILAVPLTILGLVVAALYALYVTVESRATLVASAAGVLVGGALLFVVVLVAVDLYRRGGAAARALRDLRSGSIADRQAGVANLRFIGTSAVKMTESVQQTGRGGPLMGGIMLWMNRRELDRYVLPGLSEALRDRDASVRSQAREALREVGTLEALAVLASAGE